MREREVEWVILGTYLRYPYMVKQSRLREEHFSGWLERVLWRVLRGWKNETADLSVVAFKLEGYGVTDSDMVGEFAGIQDYLLHLWNKATSPLMLSSLEDELIERYICERLKKISRELHGYAAELRGQAGIFYLTQELENLQKERLGYSAESMAQLTTELYPLLIERLEKKESVEAVPTGFPTLDRAWVRLVKGELVVVIARTKAGKTTLMLQWAIGAAMMGKKVTFFSLEMSKREIFQRILNYFAKCSMTDVRRGTLPDGSSLVTRFEQIRKDVEVLPIHIVAKPMTVTQIGMHLYADKPDIAFVDYFQLIDTSDIKAQNREQQLASISQRLVGLKQDLGITIVCAAQVNVDDEVRESKRIAMDCDLLFYLARCENKPTHDAELLVKFNRNGPSNIKVLLEFIREGEYFMETVGMQEDEKRSEIVGRVKSVKNKKDVEKYGGGKKTIIVEETQTNETNAFQDEYPLPDDDFPVP